MRKLLAGFTMLVALLFHTTSAAAAEIRFDSPEISIVLLDTPCKNSIVLALIVPESREFYQSGSVTVPDRTVPLCWRIAPDGQNIWIVDAEGEAVQLPITLFAPTNKEPTI